MNEWQPIDTAPGDFPDGDPPRLLVWVANGGPDRKGACDWGWIYIGRETGNRKPKAASHSLGDWKITHWMPVPGPPSDQAP